MLADKDDIGRYTNSKLKSFSFEDNYDEVENHNGFELEKCCEFEYKGGSKYSVLIGDKIELDGKQLTKIIVGEEDYLYKTLDDTVKLPQNYYVESSSFENIDKKDLAKYFSNLQYTSDEKMVKIEQEGFVGKYVGGIELDKKGKIANTTYDSSLYEKYGKDIHVEKKDQSFEMTELIYDEADQIENYKEQSDDKKIKRSIERQNIIE